MSSSEFSKASGWRAAWRASAEWAEVREEEPPSPPTPAGWTGEGLRDGEDAARNRAAPEDPVRVWETGCSAPGSQPLRLPLSSSRPGPQASHLTQASQRLYL